MIRSHLRQGTTLLLTTQYLEEADELADEIAVVDAGRIIARGTSDELKTQVGGERIEVVVHDRARLDEAAALVAPDGTATTDGHTRRITIAAENGAQQLVDVVGRLGEAAIGIDDVGLRRPTLDEDRHLHADARIRVDHNRRRRRGRHDEGVDRPLPLTADGSLSGAQRPHDGRHDLQHGHPRRPDVDRPRCRMAGTHERRRFSCGGGPADRLHLRDGLGRRRRWSRCSDRRWRRRPASSSCSRSPFPRTRLCRHSAIDR